jgi:hypothetical protein
MFGKNYIKLRLHKISTQIFIPNARPQRTMPLKRAEINSKALPVILGSDFMSKVGNIFVGKPFYQYVGFFYTTFMLA